jgi:hypothetical protein
MHSYELMGIETGKLRLDGIRITNPHSSAIRKSCGRCIWRPVPLRPVITEKLADINYTGTDGVRSFILNGGILGAIQNKTANSYVIEIAI